MGRRAVLCVLDHGPGVVQLRTARPTDSAARDPGHTRGQQSGHGTSAPGTIQFKLCVFVKKALH